MNSNNSSAGCKIVAIQLGVYLISVYIISNSQLRVETFLYWWWAVCDMCYHSLSSPCTLHSIHFPKPQCSLSLPKQSYHCLWCAGRVWRWWTPTSPLGGWWFPYTPSGDFNWMSFWRFGPNISLQSIHIDHIGTQFHYRGL